MSVTFVPNVGAINGLRTSAAVQQKLFSVGQVVAAEARTLVGYGEDHYSARWPQHLRDTIVVERLLGGAIRVGSSQGYALVHHEGRGPVTANPGNRFGGYLVFKVHGQWVKVRQVRAAAGTHFLTRALQRVRGRI